MNNTEAKLFFENHEAAFPLYEKLEDAIREAIGDVRIKIQKSQISFYNRHMFACVSFARVRKKSDCPKDYIVVTFGLSYKKESPRIDVATEPYPNRWTHHVLVSTPEEIDEQLMGWITEAADFANEK